MTWINEPGALERFEAKVDRSGDCHLWTGSRLAKGYGKFVLTRPTRYDYAHRLALVQKLGRDLEPGEQARHTCDNPPCVNPDHLVSGSAAENIADRQARGRQARGMRSGGSKLTDLQVREILALALLPEMTNKVLAQRYGVTPETVRKIRAGLAWTHLRQGADQEIVSQSARRTTRS